MPGSHQRKIANSKFLSPSRQTTHGSSNVAIDPVSLILTNPVIYAALANYIISYRMVMWNNEQNQLDDVFITFKDKYLPYILAEAKKLNADIAGLKDLVEKIMVRIRDADQSDAWATAYMVHIYRHKSMVNLVMQANIYGQIGSMNIQVKNETEKRTGETPTEWFLHRARKSWANKEAFFKKYMPEDCLDTHYNQLRVHITLDSLLIFVLTVTMLCFYSKFSTNLIPVIMLFSLIVSQPVYAALHLTVSGVDGLPLRRNPLCFNMMDKEMKASLLTEIAEVLDAVTGRRKQVRNISLAAVPANISLDDKVRPLADIDDTKPAKAKHGNSTSLVTYEEQSPPRVKRKRTGKVEEGEKKEIIERDSASILLENAKLMPLIFLSWQTKQFGTIETHIGKTTKDIYPLWSCIQTQNATCRFYFVYFPVEELKKRYDNGMLDECKTALEFGRVVPAIGRAGVVFDSETGHLKIKKFSSAQGTTAQGDLATHRFFFVRLEYPEDLKREAPSTEDGQYQLYAPAPDALRQTHH